MTALTPEENQGGGDDNSQATSICESTGDLASPLLEADCVSLESAPLTDSAIAVPCIAPVLDSDEILSGLERNRKSPSRFSVDVECESVASDYSELAGPLKDFEKEVQYLDRDALRAIYDGGSSLLEFDQREDFPDSDNTGSLDKREGETEEEFQRRMRKANLLSLAQEFAQLKKVDAQADAIDFHRSNSSRVLRHSNSPSPLTSRGQSLERSAAARAKSKSPLRNVGGQLGVSTNMPSVGSVPVNNFPQTPVNATGSGNGNYRSVEEDLPVNEARRRSDLSASDLPANMRPERQNAQNLKALGSQSSSEQDGDFDVYNIETTMPNLDWETLEKHLEKAATEEKSRLEACKNEREEIRRRLAMADDDDVTPTSGPEDLELSPSNSRLQAKLQGTQNMQICFMNDDLLDDEDDEESALLDNTEGNNRLHDSTGSTLPDSDDNSTVSDPNTVPSPNHPCFPGEIAHFTSRQSQLQSEATIALAQASTMARMQLEVEKQSKKKSPIADMVGIPTLGKGRKLRLSYNKLNEMNIAQLQVLVNDLHTQIELLNEDLVHLLIERDDLHMEQDSMLVDIEDLTSHCQDPATTNNNKSNHNNNRPGTRRDRFK